MHAEFMRVCARVTLIALFSLSFGVVAYAGPGHDHDHGAPSSAQSKKPTNPRVTMTSDTYEVVGILKDHVLRLYLDRRWDTAPVTTAKIEVNINGTSIAAKPQPDGSYLIESPVLEAHEKREVVVSIVSGDNSDLLVGTLDARSVPATQSGNDAFGHDHSVHHLGEDGQVHSGGVVHSLQDRMMSHPLMTFITGVILGIVLSLLLRSQRALTVLALSVGLALVVSGTAEAGPGHDHGHDQPHHEDHSATQDAPQLTPDGHIFIPKPTQRLLGLRTQVLKSRTVKRSERLIGRVIADPNKNGLVQSTIRGRIAAPENGLPVLGQRVGAGDTLALVEPAFAPIDASDVRQTAGDLEQRIAVLKARLARRRQLVDKKVASAASLQDIKIELEGLQIRRKQLDESHSKPEALRAPVSGVVANVRVVVGQVVASADTLYQIVDPDHFWVEAITFDPKLSLATAAKAVTADNVSLELTFVGRSRTLQQQATVLQYRIKTQSKSLSIGEPLTVNVETDDPVSGIIVPKEAIAEAPNGQRVAYVRHAPEQYQAVPVRAEALDGTRLHILAGLKTGDQIIVRGATLVSQIR